MTAKQCAKNIIEACVDEYEELTEEEIANMSEDEAKKFCVEHISHMIAVNGGIEWLWFVELQAIKELNLFSQFSTSLEEINERLAAY